MTIREAGYRLVSNFPDLSDDALRAVARDCEALIAQRQQRRFDAYYDAHADELADVSIVDFEGKQWKTVAYYKQQLTESSQA